MPVQMSMNHQPQQTTPPASKPPAKKSAKKAAQSEGMPRIVLIAGALVALFVLIMGYQFATGTGVAERPRMVKERPIEEMEAEEAAAEQRQRASLQGSRPMPDQQQGGPSH